MRVRATVTAAFRGGPWPRLNHDKRASYLDAAVDAEVLTLSLCRGINLPAERPPAKAFLTPRRSTGSPPRSPSTTSR